MQTPHYRTSQPAATTPCVDVPFERRERAAKMILAIAYGATPEDIVLDSFYRADEVTDAFALTEDRAESFAHVDVLLDALSPRPAPGAAL